MENEVRIEARPWEPQDLIDDLQLMIDEEPDNYLNGNRATLCMARDYLKKFFAEESLRHDTLPQKAVKQLAKVGVPYHMRGHKCLALAITLVAEDPSLCETGNLVKKLYPTIAKACGLTPTAVEIAIRRAVDYAFEHSDFEMLVEVFQGSVSRRTYKATNKQFIATLAREVRDDDGK